MDSSKGGGDGEEGLHPGNISEVELIVFSDILTHMVRIRAGLGKEDCGYESNLFLILWNALCGLWPRSMRHSIKIFS